MSSDSDVALIDRDIIAEKRSPRQGKNLFQQVKNYELYSLKELTLARL